MNRAAVNPIPEGFHTVTPYLIVKDADHLLSFLKKVFDTREMYVSRRDDNTIMHAQVRVGDSMIMFSEANEEYPAMSSMLYIYVNDVDATYKKAIQAGAISLREPINEYYGDRSAGIEDGSGIQWWIATHVEDISVEEMAKREAEIIKNEK